MSGLVVIGTFCIRFVYMGGFLFNEIITYKYIYIYIYIYIMDLKCRFLFLCHFFFFNRRLVN